MKQVQLKHGEENITPVVSAESVEFADGQKLSDKEFLSKQELNSKMNISGGIFTGMAKAQSNTSYTTAQIRNVILSTENANVSQMENGDVWIKYK